MRPVASLATPVNIEQARPEGDEALSLAIDGALTLIRGNVSLTQVGLGLSGVFQQAKHTAFLKASFNYGEKGEDTFLDQSFAHARWTWMWGELFGNEVFAQIQADSFRSLVLRQLYGGGGRVIWGDHEPTRLALGLGAMFERELYSETLRDEMREITVERVELNPRWTSYLSFSHVIRARAEIKVGCTIYYQPKIGELSDYRVLGELSAEVNLSEHFSLVESLGALYDSTPPPSVTQYDFKTVTSLRLRF